MRILAFVLAGAVASTGAAAVRELHAVRSHLDSPTAEESPSVEHALTPGDRAPDRGLALTPSSQGGGALPFGGVPASTDEVTVTREPRRPVVLDVEDAIPDQVDRCPNAPEDYDGPVADNDGCPDPLPASGPVAAVDNREVTGEIVTIPRINLPRRVVFEDR